MLYVSSRYVTFVAKKVSAVRPTLASVYTLRNRTELLQGGRPYFERLLQLLATAR
jgi:hypothetical protein